MQHSLTESAKKNNTLEDNAKDIDVTMSIYNLI